MSTVVGPISVELKHLEEIVVDPQGTLLIEAFIDGGAEFHVSEEGIY